MQALQPLRKPDDMTAIARQDFPRTAFILSVLFYAVLVAVGFDDIEEDAFIYFRFASNIADGHGYVFNIGGEPIEACSGLVWLGLVTLLTFLPLHIVLATKLLCFVFGVLCLREVFVLSQRFVADRFLAQVPPFLLVASIPFYTWSLRGLETAQYWFVMLWLVDWATNPARVRWWWLPALVVLHSRPEGFVMLAAVMPYLFFRQREAAAFWRGSAIVITGFVAVTAWRFWYFHDLVPHPFYFKVNPDHAQSLRNLFTYGWHSGWALLLLLSLPGWLKPWQSRDIALAGALLLSLLWTVFVFEDKVYNRHTGMALPFFHVFTLMLLARWLPARRVVQYGVRLLLAGLVMFTLMFSRYVHFQDSHPAPFMANVTRAVMHGKEYWGTISRLLRNPDDFNENPDKLGVFNIRYNLIASVGDFVRLNYRDDVVVVYDQIGQAPWYAGNKTFFIDNLGLGWRDIGLSRFHRSAGQSWLYGSYESLLDSLVAMFWPQERRYYDDEEIVARILQKDPAVIIARKPYLNKGRDNVLSSMLKDPAILARYRASYLLNNREIIFERSGMRESFVRNPAGNVVVPPAAKVQAITAFSWCDGLPCLELAPLP